MSGYEIPLYITLGSIMERRRGQRGGFLQDQGTGPPFYSGREEQVGKTGQGRINGLPRGHFNTLPCPSTSASWVTEVGPSHTSDGTRLSRTKKLTPKLFVAIKEEEFTRHRAGLAPV